MFLFEIHSAPVPQKQTRFGNGVAYDPSRKDKELIQWQIKAYAPKEPLQGPVKLDFTFYLPIPKSISGVRKRQMLNHVILPAKKPDLDNLAYLLTNSMKQIFYVDDSQVVEQCCRKFYGQEARTVVKVIPIVNAEQTRLDRCE